MQFRMGERGKTLHHIAGWTLSKMFTHVKRHRILGRDWCPFVNRHHFKSEERAVSSDHTLRDLVGEVQARNELYNGPGLAVRITHIL